MSLVKILLEAVQFPSCKLQILYLPIAFIQIIVFKFNFEKRTNGVQHPLGVSFTYDSSISPTITSVSPTVENSVNSLLTITGSAFSDNSCRSCFFLKR